MTGCKENGGVGKWIVFKHCGFRRERGAGVQGGGAPSDRQRRKINWRLSFGLSFFFFLVWIARRLICRVSQYWDTLWIRHLWYCLCCELQTSFKTKKQLIWCKTCLSKPWNPKSALHYSIIYTLFKLKSSLQNVTVQNYTTSSAPGFFSRLVEWGNAVLLWSPRNVL